MNFDFDSTLLLTAGEYLLRALAVVGIAVAAWFVSRWVARAIRSRLGNVKHVDRTVAVFGANLARWGVMILALLLCLNVFGVAVTSLAAMLGAAGVAVGLAFQGSLSNIAAGVLLLVVRPFKVGDIVEIADQFGHVDNIGLVATRVVTRDNELVTIPNRHILDSNVENFTAYPYRRYQVDVGVAYGTDLRRAREALEAAAERVHDTASDRSSQVALTGFGGSSIDFLVRVWGDARGWVQARDELVQAIDDELKDAEIEIPFPQRDLWVRGELPQPTWARERGPDGDAGGSSRDVVH